jgi:hypothetical protein
VPDFGLPPLVSVPVTAEFHPAAPLAQLVGDQVVLSLPVPVPAFLQPAGTAALPMSGVGSLAITDLEVDSNQLAQWGDGSPLSVSPPAQPDGSGSTPTRGGMHLVLSPLSFDLQGARAESSGVEVTASFERAPGNAISGGQLGTEVLSGILRALDVVALAFDTVTSDISTAIGDIHLPPLVSQFLDSLAPPTPGTVHIASYRFSPVQLDYPGVRFTMSSFQVDVYADTGPDKPLGNLLTVIAASRQGGLADLKRFRRHTPSKTPASPKPASAMPSGTAGTGMPTSGQNGSSGSGSQAKPNNTIIPQAPVQVIRPPSSVLIAPPPDGGGGKKADNPAPPKKPSPDVPENDSFLSDDDNPLPAVLPDIGLPDESDRPTRKPDADSGLGSGDTEPEGEGEQRPTEPRRQQPPLTAAAVGGRPDSLPPSQDVAANRADRVHGLRRTSRTVVVGVGVPALEGLDRWCEGSVVARSRDRRPVVERGLYCHSATTASFHGLTCGTVARRIIWLAPPPLLGAIASALLTRIYVRQEKTAACHLRWGYRLPNFSTVKVFAFLS